MRRWYHNHADEYNAERRGKYAQDPAARERARLRAQEYRTKKPDIGRQLYREIDGKTFPVYTSGQLAQALGCSPQLLRNLEKRGTIPQAVFPTKHRLYLKHQMQLVIDFREGKITVEQLHDGW